MDWVYEKTVNAGLKIQPEILAIFRAQCEDMGEDWTTEVRAFIFDRLFGTGRGRAMERERVDAANERRSLTAADGWPEMTDERLEKTK